jgi:hypothetical protein
MVVVSIIGVERFTAGYGMAKVTHERAMLSGPIPVGIHPRPRSMNSSGSSGTGVGGAR